MVSSIRHACVALAAAIGLTGCVTAGTMPVQSDINALLVERGASAMPASAGNTVADTADTHEALEAPLSVDRAVQVAMVRSPRLQEEYARLGLARADVLEAIQIANPRLSVSYLQPGGGPGSQLLTGVTLPLVDLLLFPARKRLASRDYDRARLDIAAAIFAVALDVQEGWYSYVGAQQVADMRAIVAQGAAASAELAKRFYDAGNISELQLKQEEAAASQARIDVGQALAAAQRARLTLNMHVGLSGAEASWQTTDRLPQPVNEEDDPQALAELAQKNNLELLASRQELAVYNSLLISTKRWRWLSGSDIGYERESEVDGSHIKGPTLGLELPIFNQGQARLARAQARTTQAQARLATVKLSTDNAVRLGAERVRTLRQIVETHRDLLIPQREAVVTRSQEQQNFMFIGVFELIQAKIKEFDAYQGYLEAVRDYWLARVDLTRAVGQRLPSDAAAGAPTPSVQDLITPPDMRTAPMPGMSHKDHQSGAQP
jgi:cobalt-zinc-cadmium efflux system outer membrane protein